MHVFFDITRISRERLNGIRFCSVIRTGSVFTQVIIVYMCDTELESDNFRVYLPSEHKPYPWQHSVMCHKLKLSFNFPGWTLNGAMYAQNIVKLVLLLFRQREDDLRFQHNNTRPHDAHADPYILQDVWQLLIVDLITLPRPIVHVSSMIGWRLSRSIISSTSLLHQQV